MAGDRPDAADADAGSGRHAGSDPAPAPPSTDAEVSVSVPEDVADWLDDQAADDPDRTRGDVLRALATAYREVADDELAGVHERLDAQRAEYVDLVEDVRERVVEVARRADESTPEGVDDPDRVDDLAADLADLESTVETGFDNYETVLEELTEAVDELSERLDTLAARVVETDDEDDERLRGLRRNANAAGVRTATCEDCGGTVDIALLTEPVCPHCRSQFVDIDTDSGLFRSPTLLVGSPPALASGEVEDDD